MTTHFDSLRDAFDRFVGDDATYAGLPKASSYLELLPAIFRSDVDEEGRSFLGQFLLAFEVVLSGLRRDEVEGIEERLDHIETYFDPAPEGTPTEFLPWLASWVALSLREDWSEKQRRAFIAAIVPLYRMRGTKAGLAQMLRIYTGHDVEIAESSSEPHHFMVNTLPANEREEQFLRAIIDQEKPAHTRYDFDRGRTA